MTSTIFCSDPSAVERSSVAAIPSFVHDRIAVATSVGSEGEPKPVPTVGPLSAESTRTPLARSSRSMAIDAARRAVLLDA